MQILASILDEEKYTFKRSHKVYSYSISDIAIIIYAFGASELAKNKSNPKYIPLSPVNSTTCQEMHLIGAK